jgi:hypothetical protein
MNKAGSVAFEAIQVASVAYRLAMAIESGDGAFHARSGFQSNPCLRFHDKTA